MILAVVHYYYHPTHMWWVKTTIRVSQIGNITGPGNLHGYHTYTHTHIHASGFEANNTYTNS